MRHLLPLLLVLLGPANLLANPVALSSAVIDWTHWSITVGGGLQISHIDYPRPQPFYNFALAATSEGQILSEIGVNPASADFAYSNNLGYATASASAIDGLLHSSAEAGAVSVSENFALSRTQTGLLFWLYGTGSGTLSVTVPYQLTAVCSPVALNEQISAQTSVSLSGPSGGFQRRDLSCADGPSSKTGNLMIVSSFVNPNGPLVSFDAFAETHAVASIPDSGSSSALFAIGVLGVGVVAGLIRRFSW